MTALNLPYIDHQQTLDILDLEAQQQNLRNASRAACGTS